MLPFVTLIYNCWTSSFLTSN